MKKSGAGEPSGKKPSPSGCVIRIGRRLVLVNRVRPGTADAFAADLAALGQDVVRLPDVPQDDAVERSGAEGRTVFGLEDDSPAVQAAKRIVDKLEAGS